jgi:glutamate--cysteine ligase
MDVDPFEPTGISLQSARFLDVFLLFCALDDSPALSDAQSAIHTDNFARTVKEGRRPGLTLRQDDADISLRVWGEQLLQRMAPVAALLDAQRGDSAHADSMAQQAAKLANPDATPSARVLAQLKDNDNSFSAFGLRQSAAHAAYFRAHPPSALDQADFAERAAQSIAQQVAIEMADSGNFDDFVEAYLASSLCPQS